jgi:hypothetical protein
MAQYTILYIGFSFTDHYLNDLRSSVIKMLRESSDPTNLTPLAYAISYEKCEEDRNFILKHEGVHFLNYEGNHRGFDEILKSIYMQTSPTIIFGRTLSKKRLIWNDPFNRAHWIYLRAFINKCVRKATRTECSVTFCDTAVEAVELVKNNEGNLPYDLIITQYGDNSGEALTILKEMKRMQVQKMEQGRLARNKETVYRQFTEFPSIIVEGMMTDFRERRNQVTRLGCLDYIGWGFGADGRICEDKLNVYDFQFLGSIHRALSSPQEY